MPAEPPVHGRHAVCSACRRGRSATTLVAALRPWRRGCRAFHAGSRRARRCPRCRRIWPDRGSGLAAYRGWGTLWRAPGLARRLAGRLACGVARGHVDRVGRRRDRCLACRLAHGHHRLRNTGRGRNSLAAVAAPGCSGRRGQPDQPRLLRLAQAPSCVIGCPIDISCRDRPGRLVADGEGGRQGARALDPGEGADHRFLREHQLAWPTDAVAGDGRVRPWPRRRPRTVTVGRPEAGTST